MLVKWHPKAIFVPYISDPRVSNATWPDNLIFVWTFQALEKAMFWFAIGELHVFFMASLDQSTCWHCDAAKLQATLHAAKTDVPGHAVPHLPTRPAVGVCKCKILTLHSLTLTLLKIDGWKTNYFLFGLVFFLDHIWIISWFQGGSCSGLWFAGMFNGLKAFKRSREKIWQRIFPSTIIPILAPPGDLPWNVHKCATSMGKPFHPWLKQTVWDP